MAIRTMAELTAAGALPETMPQVTLGRSGLQVASIGWGAIGLPDDTAAAEAIWQAYARRGGNFIDTAPAYQDSELLIGRHLSAHRGEYQLATKSHPVDADQTLRDIETSLQRLGTDVIDLFYAPHGCWSEDRLAACLKRGGVIDGAIKARERGLCRHLAFSYDYFAGLDIRRLRELIETDIFEVMQLPFGLVMVEPVDEEILPLAREKGLGVIANFPTIDGLTAREWGVFWADFAGLVDTPGQASLLAVLSHPGVDCLLTRFSSVARVEENCAAARLAAALTDAEKTELRQRILAHGGVRYLQRDDCPPAPPELHWRRQVIYYDLYSRFGYGAARRQVEQFVRQLAAHADYAWNDEARAVNAEIQRACPVLLT